MDTLIVSPLFPPDAATAAQYAKELAHRTEGSRLLVFGHLPEAVSGVKIETVDKRSSAPWRLFQMTRALFKSARDADRVWLLNGPSVELPMYLVSWVCQTPVTFIISDTEAYERTCASWWRSFFLTRVEQMSAHVVSSVPKPKPRIHPLEATPSHAIAEWEHAWNLHSHQLNRP